jgi:hypothetical protein
VRSKFSSSLCGEEIINQLLPINKQLLDFGNISVLCAQDVHILKLHLHRVLFCYHTPSVS